jgi:hypothetical protein
MRIAAARLAMISAGGGRSSGDVPTTAPNEPRADLHR